MLRGRQRAGSHKRERSRETSGRAHEEREGLPVKGSHRALLRRLCVTFVYFDEPRMPDYRLCGEIDLPFETEPFRA